MTLRASMIALCLCATPLAAKSPSVVTDIPPVHSLASMVMEGVGTPDVLLNGGGSAHDLSLKPSQARQISGADLVVWVGPALTPGFEDQLEALAPDAVDIRLMETDGVHKLRYRETAVFEHAADHAAHEDHGDAHDDHADKHDDHSDHAQDDHAEEDDHDGHHHVGEHDPHLWLDPDNAVLWLEKIAGSLGKIDPDNSDLYHANADAAAEDIKAASDRAKTILAPVHDAPLAAYHDAYQYFESAFDLKVVGAIADSDSAKPGPRRLTMLRDAFEHDKPRCFLMEPGGNAKLIASVGWGDLLETAGGKDPLAQLDPIGAHLMPGPDMYPALLEDMAQRIADCAG